MTGKWVELLKTIAPEVSRVAFLFNPQATAGGGAYFMEAIDAAVVTQKVKSIMALVHDREGIESAFSALAREPGAGVVVLPYILTASHHQLIIAKAAHYRVPTIYNYRFMVERGGLISYGVDLDNLFERAENNETRRGHRRTYGVTRPFLRVAGRRGACGSIGFERPTVLFSLRPAELIQGFFMQDLNLSQVSLRFFNAVPYGVQLFLERHLASTIQRGFKALDAKCRTSGKGISLLCSVAGRHGSILEFAGT